MFLEYKKNKSFVCDFQLIYDTDNKLHLDFYAYGLLKEPCVLNLKAKYKLLDYGLIEISKKKYKLISKKMNKITKNLNYMKNITTKMKNSIYRLIESNIEFERLIESGIYDYNVCKKCFDCVTDVMAYRRIADLSGEYYSKSVCKERYSKIGIPSYLITLNENKQKINDLNDIKIFIKEYSYLSTFNIDNKKYEDINNYTLNVNAQGNLKPINIPFDKSKCKNNIEEIVYSLSWYSEMRHIYQLRTLRNFKLFMEAKNMDIYNTDIRMILNYV
ncbi:hypothetical protein JYG23_09895 [Sedimentibacter sp. zth1]|uniref:hypothetical protein n=1 Tax=Sedimentibacter sp. zth1 TaxID=2816908 RepID=UPI001A91006D|nr:hypothetical protein [Sedimentibacter sp. zth1]QSX04999.1 hypothetical protein JYG23_09895 [Sedimentibacter sp. zth1]